MITSAPPSTRWAYGSVPVQVNRRGVLCPAAFAEWMPYDAAYGGAVPYGGSLYGSPEATAPLQFPQRADANGLIEVWSAEPVRIIVSAWISGYPAVRHTLDLQFTEDETEVQVGPPGSPGSPGSPGADGAPGPKGVRGSLWFSGSGGPGAIPAAVDQDFYLDVVTGDVWYFEDGTPYPYGSGPYGSGPYGGVG